MTESRVMTWEEEHEISVKCRELRQAGKAAEAHELSKTRPIPVEQSKVWIRLFGKETFLKEGYNLYEVEKEFGKDWART